MSTDEFKEETLKVNSGVASLLLLKIQHDDFDDDIRIVADTDTITHQGVDYEPYDVSAPLMSEGTTAPKTSIVIKDITRTLVSKFRSVLDSLTIEISVVSTLDLDEVELEVGTFNITQVAFSNYDVTLTVTKPTVLNNSLSSYTLDADNFPGLFLL